MQSDTRVRDAESSETRRLNKKRGPLARVVTALFFYELAFYHFVSRSLLEAT